MKDRLRQARQAATDLAERAQRLIPGGKSDVDDPSDDEDDDDLPEVDASSPVDKELARLDEEDAEPMVRRILDLVGDRLSLSVGPDGVTVRGLLRRRRTAWKHVEHLTFGGRYDLVRSDGLAKIMDDIRAKVGLPIPGLSWLIRKVVNGLANWLEKRVFTPEEVESLKVGAGNALLAIQRRGRDIELSGPLLLVSILAPGFSEAVEQEARTRGIEVEVQASNA